MNWGGSGTSEGGHGELKEYAERQIRWVEEERARVQGLLTPPTAEG
jgi:hypothetical protein